MIDNVKIINYLQDRIQDYESGGSKITAKGVQLPVKKDIYNPILKELIDYGIEFNEHEIPFKN